MIRNDIKLINLLKKAQKKIQSFDKIEKAYGNSNPVDCPLDIYLDTVREALATGITLNDWDCIAEAHVMLSQGIEKFKGKKHVL